MALESSLRPGQLLPVATATPGSLQWLPARSLPAKMDARIARTRVLHEVCGLSVLPGDRRDCTDMTYDSQWTCPRVQNPDRRRQSGQHEALSYPSHSQGS